MACGFPDTTLGAAQRYSVWLDCQAATIGSDGFLALAGYTLDSGLLTSVLTIFVALIGYRLLLGGTPDLAEGTGWAIKLGIVLTFLAGWTAFQTIFYDLAIAAPADIAARISQAGGIAHDGGAVRMQRVYDALRLGLDVGEAGVGEAQGYQAQPALPITAMLFLVAGVGLPGAAKLAAGFLLALAPLAALALLFGPGIGLFAGWLRALLTAILASSGLAVSAGLLLTALEAEVARMQALGVADYRLMDEQAPLAAVIIFIAVALALVFASARMAGGLAEAIWRVLPAQRSDGSRVAREASKQDIHSAGQTGERTAQPASEQRVVAIAEAFSRASERTAALAAASGAERNDRGRPSGGGTQQTTSGRSTGSSATGRRALGRRHGSSIRRDRIA